MTYKCFKCDDPATWEYAPGKGEPKDYYCDEHVSRGCSCTHVLHYYGDDENPSLEDNIREARENGELVDDEGYRLDDECRRQPCCEYWRIDDWQPPSFTLFEKIKIFIYDIVNGIHSGIPLCCVMFFAKRVFKGSTDGVARDVAIERTGEFKFDGVHYVQCDCCYADGNSKPLKRNGSICNWLLPYYDGDDFE